MVSGSAESDTVDPMRRGPLLHALAILALGLSSCSSVDVVRLDRGGYAAIDPARPRILIVVAHPDDELVAAGAMYLHGAARGGIVDVLTLTDGQGGFKYAVYAEARTGIELTREDIGRRELPALRRSEQIRGLELLGARRLIRLEELDSRYSKDRMEVLAPSAGVWDLARIDRTLDGLLADESYGFIVTISPTATTHGHHQAATLLAIGAAARVPDAKRPVVLCCQVERHDGDGIGKPPEVLKDALLARLRTSAPPFTIDRTKGYGHKGNVTLKSIAGVAVAQHLSQGTMLNYVGQGDVEEYWILDASPSDAQERCAALFSELNEGPLFPDRQYESSAGTNVIR